MRWGAMRTKLLPFLPLLCLGLVLAAACDPQVSPTAVRPPTSVPRTEGVPPTAAKNPFARPAMTVQGQLEDGTPIGVTGDGNYFKGSPDAPVILFEFSDYQ
jgi:hypothetical protein